MNHLNISSIPTLLLFTNHSPAGLTLIVVTSILVMLLLLFFFAILSAAEISFFSLKPNQLKEIRINETDKDDLVAELLQNPKRLLATILITVNFTNIAIVVLSTYITSLMFDFESFPLMGFIIQVIVVTVLILFFGEILPKVYATHNIEKVAIQTAGMMKSLVKIVKPFSNILVSSTNIVDKNLARRNRGLSMDELEEAIEITSEEGSPEKEKSLLKSIVNFGETEVKDIMRPRIFITAVDFELDFRALMSGVLDAGYSRVPVFEGNLDKVVGILHFKDLLPHVERDEDFGWQQLIRPPLFIPENKKINDLLAEFQRKKIHMAVIVDEYGGTSGIVTMEDILEEIVGEIHDEFDLETEGLVYSKLDDLNFIFPGEVPIPEFCRLMNVDPDIFEKVKGESGTLAGLILEILGKFPEKNEKISYNRFIFRIEAVNERRIEKVKISISEATNEQ